MSVDTILSNNGLTAEAAYQFIVDNLSAPDVVYTAASDAGFTVSDLTELVTRFDNAISRDDVSNFFANAGLDPSAMAPTPTEPSPDDGTDAGNSTIRTNGEGLSVIEPQEPLTDEQKLFIGGLEEARSVSQAFGSEGSDSIVERTSEGFLFNVDLGDQDANDVIGCCIGIR